MNNKILQIIPAPVGMCARYEDENGMFTTPIVCLALFEEDGYRYVEPMDMIDNGVIGSACGANFKGIVFKEDLDGG